MHEASVLKNENTKSGSVSESGLSQASPFTKNFFLEMQRVFRNASPFSRKYRQTCVTWETLKSENQNLDDLEIIILKYAGLPKMPHALPR